ncbi:hypothetical protein [Arthrobacter sp. CP30]
MKKASERAKNIDGTPPQGYSYSSAWLVSHTVALGSSIIRSGTPLL